MQKRRMERFEMEELEILVKALGEMNCGLSSELYCEAKNELAIRNSPQERRAQFQRATPDRERPYTFWITPRYVVALDYENDIWNIEDVDRRKQSQGFRSQLEAESAWATRTLEWR